MEEECPESSLWKAEKAGGLLVFTLPLAAFLAPVPGSLALEGIWREFYKKLILGLQHPSLLSHNASKDSDSTMKRGCARIWLTATPSSTGVCTCSAKAHPSSRLCSKQPLWRVEGLAAESSPEGPVHRQSAPSSRLGSFSTGRGAYAHAGWPQRRDVPSSSLVNTRVSCGKRTTPQIAP